MKPQKEKPSEIWNQAEIIDEFRDEEHRICIKIFSPKFLYYVNQINSSISDSRVKKIQGQSSQELEKCRIPTFELESQQHLCSYEFFQASQRKKTKNRKKKPPLRYKVIEGKIIQGVIEGYAHLELENGCTFKGKVEYGDIKEGHLIYPDGTVYTGRFANSLPDGPGKLIYQNGTQYSTIFKHGLPGHQAQITYSNGDMYKGPINKFKKHGLGKLIMKNGNKYVGDFSHGQITGRGTYYVNSKPIASGFWRNGEFLYGEQNNQASISQCLRPE